MTQAFSDKRVSILVILLAVAARIIQLLFYLDSFFDTTFQVIATQNLVEGHGISTAVVNPNDLSATIYQPLINWPPGYSLLLTPFYLASGQEYLLACFVLDVLAATALILLSRRILFLLDVSVAVVNVFTLVTGFFIYYFYFTGSTDSISIAFFLAAVYFTLAAIKSGQRWTSRAALTGLCLFLSASMKYLFFPVVFTIPVFLLIYSYQNASAGARRAALVSFAVAAAGIAALFLYQKSISGAGTYISATGRGFFPEHLLRAHPFIPSSFITTTTIRKFAGDQVVPVMNLFRIVHLLLFIGLIIYTASVLFKSGLKKAVLSKAFLFLAFSLMIAISLALAVLSLLVDKELIPPDRWWTYVEDARYYGFADILMHLSVFLLFYHYRKQSGSLMKFVLLLLPFLLLPEAIRGTLFTAKRIVNAGKEEYYWQKDQRFQKYVASFLRHEQDSSQVKKMVVSGSLYYGNYRTSLHQRMAVMEEVEMLNQPGLLKTKETVLLLAIIREDRLTGFQPFITYPRTKLAGKFNGFYFYTLYVLPD